MMINLVWSVRYKYLQKIIFLEKKIYFNFKFTFKCLRINTIKRHLNYFKKFKCVFFSLFEAFKATIHFDHECSESRKNENIYFIFMNFFCVIEILSGKVHTDNIFIAYISFQVSANLTRKSITAAFKCFIETRHKLFFIVFSYGVK